MRYSESLKNIASALSKVQSEIRNPIKDNINKGVMGSPKYANLEDTLAEYVRPVLTKHGMSVFQSVRGEEGRVGVSTTLFHESGEFIEGDYVYCDVNIPVSNSGKKILTEGQATGVCITYLRRYSLNAALGINGDKDTDGSYTETPVDTETPKPKEEKPTLKKEKAPAMSYDEACKVIPKGSEKTLKEIYDTEGKDALIEIYKKGDAKTKAAINAIAKKLNEEKKAKENSNG